MRRRRRLSEEERKALWHKAVMEKGRKLKRMCDVAVFVLLLIPLGSFALPFIGGRKEGEAPGWVPKRGYEIVIQLVRKGTHPHLEPWRDSQGLGRVHKITGRKLLARKTEDAGVMAFALLAVPAGALLLLFLYVLDLFVWMGRALPWASGVYGLGGLAYLLAAKFPEEAAWNMLGEGAGARPAWLMLIIPLFLLAAVSLVRSAVSQRWKRYEFAGLPVPEHLKPGPEPEKKEEEEQKAEEKEEERAGAEPEAAPVEVPGKEGGGKDKAEEGEPEGTGGPDEKEKEEEPGPAAGDSASGGEG